MTTAIKTAEEDDDEDGGVGDEDDFDEMAEMGAFMETALLERIAQKLV